MYMGVCLSMYMQVPLRARRRPLIPWSWHGCCLAWVLETECWSSARTIHRLFFFNCLTNLFINLGLGYMRPGLKNNKTPK